MDTPEATILSGLVLAPAWALTGPNPLQGSSVVFSTSFSFLLSLAAAILS